ncbi:ras GEF [Heliocybe sulcata]|uniref:Ras GEF n=1 Tax=Heliocybe sulcata TaxID=5364 RepID=A0A5C3NIR4_9AGAM|nr:ras GEF [Heliocybe sulcata]
MPWPTISIAVVGTSHCGKSTFVEKGLKAYNLSKPTACSVPVGDNGSFNYTFRTGKIPRPHSSHGRVLGLMEVDVPARNLDHVSTSAGPVWPGGAPDIQGVLICYDSSDETSFQPVERLLREYRELKLPTVVVACKSDLERRVPTRKGHSLASSFDTGIVEVSEVDDAGTEKMQRCFDWLLRAIFKEKRIDLTGSYRNPASPDVLDSQIAWEPPRSNNTTPTPASVAAQAFIASSKNSRSGLRTPTSPTRARSTSDLASEHERQRNLGNGKGRADPSSVAGSDFQGDLGSRLSMAPVQSATSGIGESAESLSDSREKEASPVPWATVDQLLDKLLFLAISGDDPTFITHFLLTYRRFATPRSVLLAMQKRMIQLTQSSSDPMFSAYAQMRICHLLERWMQDYRGDFAVGGTQGAFNAVINTVVSKTYLLHYGSEFLSFRDELPTLVDNDASWGSKPREFSEGSDDSSSSHHGDGESLAEVPRTAKMGASASDPSDMRNISRERRPSLPLTAKSLVIQTTTLSVNSSQSSQGDSSEMSQKQIIKELQKMAHEVNNLESTHIAQEITLIEARLFLDIQPRHWLKHILVPGRKEPDTDSIARFNQVSSHLADWVVSLILCHDRPKARAKQIEKFVDIAYHLRRMNNYSALRAFVAGVNNSTFQGDETMAAFKEKSEKHYKQLQSYDVLLQSIRSHRAYRMALRNTRGACIPALEVHISDLIRTHEGNPDVKADDPSKIHWGKYNLMGRFISTIIQCQVQCRTSLDYDFPEQPHISDLLLKDCLMGEGVSCFSIGSSRHNSDCPLDCQMQQSRIAAISDGAGADDGYGGGLVNPPSGKDPTLIKKIFFW